MTTTGGDDINLAPENTSSDHDHDDLNLEGHNDDTGDSAARATVPAIGGRAGTKRVHEFQPMS
jgi:hypothetical protein